MSDKTFLRVQLVQLRQLLDMAGDDPIMRPQLTDRIGNLEEELRKLEQSGGRLFSDEPVSPVRVALFMSGGGVNGTESIKSSLACEALREYEQIYVEQAMHDERDLLGRQRRKRGSAKPELWFTGTPRGSFGLEFVPSNTSDPESAGTRIASLRNVADLLSRITSQTFDWSKELESVPPRVLTHVKKFFKTLADHDIELKIAFSDQPARKIAKEQIHRVSNLFEKEVFEQIEYAKGTYRGLARETFDFNFVKTDGTVIAGKAADDLTEDDFDRFEQLLNKSCKAELQKIEYRQQGGTQTRVKYVLIDLSQEESTSETRRLGTMPGSVKNIASDFDDTPAGFEE